MQHLATFQPAIGTLDQPQHVYLSRGADPTGTAPDINETERVAWVPLSETIEMIARGEIVGGACVVALYRALSLVQ